MLLALPVQFSAELVAAAICCCLRCYRSMPSPCRGVKINTASLARIACSLDCLDSPEVQPPWSAQAVAAAADGPPAGAGRRPHDASFKPRTLKLPALPSS